MILTFEIFGRARNHGKKFPKLCQTSFSGIVHCKGNVRQEKSSVRSLCRFRYTQLYNFVFHDIGDPRAIPWIKSLRFKSQPEMTMDLDRSLSYVFCLVSIIMTITVFFRDSHPRYPDKRNLASQNP